LLSETTRALLGSALPDGVSVHPMGERRLKDLDEPERVYELVIDGVEPEATIAAHDADAGSLDDAEFEARMEKLGQRLSADIKESVLRRLERTLGQKPTQ